MITGHLIRQPFDQGASKYWHFIEIHRVNRIYKYTERRINMSVYSELLKHAHCYLEMQSRFLPMKIMQDALSCMDSQITVPFTIQYNNLLRTILSSNHMNLKYLIISNNFKMDLKH